MKIIHIHDIKGKEVFYYDDIVTWTVRIGVRGLGEFVVPKWDIDRAESSFFIKNNRRWTEQEAIEWAINWATRESEYIEFEEIKIEQLRIG